MSESERYELWREAEMAARLRAWELWAERQGKETCDVEHGQLANEAVQWVEEVYTPDTPPTEEAER